MTRTQVADRIQDQIYEDVKLELPSEVSRLQEAGFSEEALDRELSSLIEERQETCKQQQQEKQEEIAKLKTKVSELRKRKLERMS